MGKLVPLIVVVVAAIALFVSVYGRGGTSSSKSGEAISTTSGDATTNTDIARNDAPGATQNGGANGVSEEETYEDLEGGELDERPATEIYKSADEALAAVLKGAKSYDDLLLEQFTELGDSCTWCNEFYSKVKEPLQNAETPADERSYLAEILAVSGRLDNVKTLVDALGAASDQDTKDIYAEAIELSSGGQDVVQYLGTHLEAADEGLKEASVAALTNQGSRLAVELLFDHTVKTNNEDGYYSMGIGVGEVVPDEEAFPYLQEKFLKRDKYSNLAAKALLNSGVDGLRLMYDLIGSGNNAEFDGKILDDSIDHVAFDDETIEYIRTQAASNKNPRLKAFSEKVLKEYEDTAADDDDFDDSDAEELFTPSEQ